MTLERKAKVGRAAMTVDAKPSIGDTERARIVTYLRRRLSDCEPYRDGLRQVRAVIADTLGKIESGEYEREL